MFWSRGWILCPVLQRPCASWIEWLKNKYCRIPDVTDFSFQPAGSYRYKEESASKSEHRCILFVFMLCSSVTLALGILTGWHCRLISYGETSIEWHSNRDDARKLRKKGLVSNKLHQMKIQCSFSECVILYRHLWDSKLAFFTHSILCHRQRAPGQKFEVLKSWLPGFLCSLRNLKQFKVDRLQIIVVAVK